MQVLHHLAAMKQTAVTVLLWESCQSQSMAIILIVVVRATSNCWHQWQLSLRGSRPLHLDMLRGWPRQLALAGCDCQWRLGQLAAATQYALYYIVRPLLKTRTPTVELHMRRRRGTVGSWQTGLTRGACASGYPLAVPVAVPVTQSFKREFEVHHGASSAHSG